MRHVFLNHDLLEQGALVSVVLACSLMFFMRAMRYHDAINILAMLLAACDGYA